MLKLKLKVMKIEFIVSFTTKLGAYVDKKLKCEIGDTPELTFKNCLKSLPKYIRISWQHISFNQIEHNFSIRRDWLIETNYDFNNSVLMTSLAE